MNLTAPASASEKIMNNDNYYANQQLVEGTDRSGGLVPLPTAIPLLLDHVVNGLVPIANRKNQILHCYADTHLNRCYLMDNIRLSEILNNFISNAIKFTPEHGEIIVRAQLIERIDNTERIRFSVKDNGMGISDDIQSYILMGHTKFGLGLSVCQHLANLLNGYIEFVSQLGEGSVFSIILTLPICANVQTTLHDIEPLGAFKSKVQYSPTYGLALND